MSARRIRVLVVDDSALVRKVLTEGLAQDPQLEVLGSASNPYEARDMLVRLRPDVMTLDVEMPRMDGVEFLRRLMPQFPIPVVMVSALTQRGQEITLNALAAGAVDFVTKPSRNLAGGLQSMMMELRTKLKVAMTANVSHWKGRALPHASKPAALAESTDKVVAIGASTGGTEATKTVLQQLPKLTPGVVVVQHMPAGFTKMYAQRLNEECPQHCLEAEDGMRVAPGKVYVAPGDRQLTVIRSGGQYLLRCRPGEKVSGHCPSVDVMFKSVALHVGRNAIGVLLTGMGRDGADGMLEMKKAGARTVAQDRASSVVFGMPKEALANGGAEEAISLDRMGEAILGRLRPVGRAA